MKCDFCNDGECCGQIEQLEETIKEMGDSTLHYFNRSEKRKQALGNALLEIKQMLLEGPDNGRAYWIENAIELIDSLEEKDDRNL